MAVSYIHLSDIHFGQERGGRVVIHDDVKARLLDDVSVQVKNLPKGKATGVIVTGDIAYSAKQDQYAKAAEWLDQLTAAVGCKNTAVRVVPGNHDIDRTEISAATKLMLEKISTEGEPALDSFLATDKDRELLDGRFRAYRPFAEGYDCPLDSGGGGAGDKVIEIAPNRFLRFVGLNTALCCSENDQKGKLLLGARQRVLPVEAGHELIVLAHHPLDWLQDSEDASRYIRSRARVFISGHEHNPSLKVERINGDTDLMLLASGATVPFKSEDNFTYTYNILEFSWIEDSDTLGVTIHPRAWSQQNKSFEADSQRLGSEKPSFKLNSPNFKRGQKFEQRTPTGIDTQSMINTAVDSAFPRNGNTMQTEYPSVLLHFFRDLNSAQRLSILVKLGAFPSSWIEPLTHAFERQALDSLVRQGKIQELKEAIKLLKSI